MTEIALGNFIDAFIDALRDAKPLADVEVFDGLEVNADYSGTAIVIGHDGVGIGQDITVATAQNAYKPLGAQRMDEIGVVDCMIYAVSGESTFSELRKEAFAILSKVDTLIREDSSFKKIAHFSGLATTVLRYSSTNQGNGVKLVFSVRYQART